MKRTLAVMVMLLCAGAASAQMYKWKDAKGVTHYTDTPPPASAAPKNVEVKSFQGGGGASLPSELATVARSSPVTLYSTAQCDACAQARAMLTARGIPFTEKTVDSAEDHAVLKKAGSVGQLPLLLVGRAKQIGYEQAIWDETLTAAGYPIQSILPANYQQAAATPAAPREQRAAKAAVEQAQPAQRLPPVNAPPNFQF